MRNKILKLWLFFSLLIIITQADAQTPIEFNNILTRYIDSLYKLGEQWGAKFNEVNKTKKYSDLFSTRTKMEKFVDQSVLKIQKMKDVSGSKDLRDAVIKFLYFEKKALATAFLPVEKLSAKSTDKEIKDALNNLTAISDQESKKLKEINSVQKAYAAKNGFVIADQ